MQGYSFLSCLEIRIRGTATDRHLQNPRAVDSQALPWCEASIASHAVSLLTLYTAAEQLDDWYSGFRWLAAMSLCFYVT